MRRAWQARFSRAEWEQEQVRYPTTKIRCERRNRTYIENLSRMKSVTGGEPHTGQTPATSLFVHSQGKVSRSVKTSPLSS